MPLNVIVCLKQIPNPDLQFQPSADGKDIRRDALNYKTNGADEYALEEAVRLKEKHGGRVTAITAGPKPRNPIILLFTGPEESATEGAVAFITEHRWANDVRVVLNMDGLAVGRLVAPGAAVRSRGGVIQPCGALLLQERA